MSFFKIFKRDKPQPQSMPDNVPYYWGTQALDDFNAILAKRISELEEYTSKLSKLA